MSMIFPGMDPYLEDPLLWPGLHTSLVVYLRNQLQPLLRPRYIARIEERVYVEGSDHAIVPDFLVGPTLGPRATAAAVLANADAPVIIRAPELEIHEVYLAIVERGSRQNVVTVLEVVSPTNKVAGPGRDSYLTKQREVRRSPAHLVEVDLLRGGPHVLAVPERLAREQGAYDTLVCVNRSKSPRDEFEIYPRRVRERLPRIRVPLAGSDPDVILDLQTALDQAYEDACYEVELDYSVPCRPPLSPDDQAWANQLIAEARQRSA